MLLRRQNGGITTIIVSSNMSLRSDREGKADLPCLLQRQKKQALVQAITEGHCRSLKDLCLRPPVVNSRMSEYLSYNNFHLLVDALRVDTPPPNLARLTLNGVTSSANLYSITSTLGFEGVLPSLKDLMVFDKFEYGAISDIDVEYMADMVQHRANAPLPLEVLGGKWFTTAPSRHAFGCCASCSHR